MPAQPAYLWDEIRRNRRRSWVLMILIGLLLAGTGGAFGAAYGGDAGAALGLGLAAVLALVLGMVSYYAGGSIMLSASSARRIEKRDHPQLFNVVEEMAIASGLPMPAVYVINDTAPNAFATGRDPAHASVAITTGLLEKLNREEVQGVMAHEMSHVRNHDILYATMVGVMVGSIALMCDVFRRMAFYGGRRRSSDRERGGGAAVIMLIALLLAILAPIFAKLLQMAVSRRREYLADASAAELTRNPEGLARALEKISGDQEVLEVANRATMHLYIVNPIKSFEERAAGLFSTHPPTEERVRVLRGMTHSHQPAAPAGG
ncbi:MAG TPA: M48 family metallopeptidase [Planctomycetota bacterium]|nr:M48 family metallopeptidase [Planctomycetota bacterium]